MLKQPSLSKRQKQLIARFNYYAKSLHEQLNQVSNTNFSSTKRSEKDIGQSRYNYIRSVRDNFQHFQIITQEFLTNIAKQIYLTRTENLKQGKQFAQFQQNQIFIFSGNKYTIPTHNESHPNTQRSIISTPSSKHPQQYSIFIVHANSNPNQWFYYVEKITLTYRSENESSLVYQSIFAFRKQSGFLQYILKPFLSQHKIIKYALNYEEKLVLFCSTLQKQLKNLKIQNTKEYLKSHPSFKREDKLPLKEYQKFQKLKQEIYHYYTSINQFKKIKTYSIDNLICRFMKFKEYDYNESLKAVKYYLDWQKKMRIKCTQQSLAKYSSLGLYELIGKDKQGRLLLFFRPHKIIVNTIQNQQEYIDYCMYMLDLYIEDHTQGYIDEYFIISDYQYFTSDNFKLSIARAIAQQSKELFPERQYKVVCYGLGSFSYFIFKIIRPFLPEFILDKIAIFGTDKQEITQFLAKIIDISSLPADILGEKTPSS